MPHFEACSTVVPTWIGYITYERGGSGIWCAGRRPQRALRRLREKIRPDDRLARALRSGLMTAATRARVRVGMADAREGARWFYTHRVTASRHQLHAVDRVLRVVAASA